MNKVILIGNLTRDPESSTTQNGTAVCRLSIAVNREFTNSDGSRDVDYFNIITWRGQAENCAKFLKKGNKVGIVGRLENRSYEDKDRIKRTITEVIASEVEFLTPKQAESETVAQAERPRQIVLEPINDDGLPF
jgi:single-strand DNA-binding protein